MVKKKKRRKTCKVIRLCRWFLIHCQEPNIRKMSRFDDDDDVDRKHPLLRSSYSLPICLWIGIWNLFQTEILLCHQPRRNKQNKQNKGKVKVSQFPSFLFLLSTTTTSFITLFVAVVQHDRRGVLFFHMRLCYRLSSKRSFKLMKKKKKRLDHFPPFFFFLSFSRAVKGVATIHLR